MLICEFISKERGREEQQLMVRAPQGRTSLCLLTMFSLGQHRGGIRSKKCRGLKHREGMRGSRYVEELHCSQGSGTAMTYSSRIPLAPWERTHRSENPVVLSKYVLCTHLHVGSAPLPKYVWGARVPPLPAVGSGVAMLGWSSPSQGSPVGVWWVLMAEGPAPPHAPPGNPAVLGMPPSLLAFINANKQSRPEFERKGCIVVPLKDN